jgi:DNA-binding transcriptional LysR family regulator
MLVSPERVLNLYRLYVFYAVARNLSFSEAADQLHTSQPNISKHVRLLENELRTELFDRPGRQVTLTDAGRIVYDYTERVFGVVGEMRRALDELQGLERGYLRLGASSTPGLYILPTLIANFWELYPGLEVTLNLGNSQEIVSKMLANQIDLGFVEGSEMTPGIQAQPLISDQLVWIVSPGSALAQKSQVDVSDLAQETAIWREAGSGTRQAMARFLASVGIKPRHSFVLQSCEGVKRAVAAGLGISLVSQRAIYQEVQLKTLMILKGSGLQESGQLIIISRKDLRPTAATLAFLAHVRKSVQ